MGEGGLVAGLCDGPWRKMVLALVIGQILIICVILQSSSHSQVVMQTIGSAVHHLNPLASSKRTDTSIHSVLLDIHKEDPVLGHTWSDLDHIYLYNQTYTNETLGIDKMTIAIGLGITSRGTKNLNNDNIKQTMTFFITFLPSFCQTCSQGFKYHFFIAYDNNDPFFTKEEFLKYFTSSFTQFTSDKCPSGSQYHLHYVQCSHSRKPAWAQNDAMMEAYFSDMAYYYRINDDTAMKTPGWTETYIKTLSGMDPPNIGVVGPTHQGGNMGILTYDFVSYHHVEIFGFYYPRCFPDWYGDRWITDVYKPGRTLKLPEVRLDHTMKMGQRYINHRINKDVVNAQIGSDKNTLLRYIKAVNSDSPWSANPKYVIAMTIRGKDPVLTYGAVRNAIQRSIYFPEWTVRVYVPEPDSDLAVPALIISKLKQYGAEVVTVPKDITDLPPEIWHYLVADDHNLERFLIHNVQSRFSDRMASVIETWLKNEHDRGLLCIRDHNEHKSHAIVDGLFGGVTQTLHEQWQNSTMKSLLLEHIKQLGSQKFDVQAFLDKRLWSVVNKTAVCYDSVSCDQWAGSRPFPVLRQKGEYLGLKFGLYEQAENVTPTVLPGSAPDKCNTQKL